MCDKKEDMFLNGEVWERAWPDCRRMMILYFGHGDEPRRESQWGLLLIGRSVYPKLSSPGFQHKKDGSFIFTESEVAAYVIRKGKKCALRVEFVDNKEDYF